jgi:hypothetical protein
MSEDGERVPMVVVGVRVELPSNNPIVLLREEAGARYLPIWIGRSEAESIAFAMEGHQAPRPQTHDLLKLVMEGLGASLERVVVTELRDSVYYADLVLLVDHRQVHISSRPSDAIALAVRTKSPVFASNEVLEAAGIEIEEGVDDEAAQQEAIERFRKMLENATVEDFMGDDPEA